MSSKSIIYRNLNILICNFLTDKLSASCFTKNNTCGDLVINQLLQIYNPHGSMTTPACAKIILKFSEKEEKVKEVYDLSRVKVRPDDGRIYLVVKRKPISSTSYIGLVEKLYDQYY